MSLAFLHLIPLLLLFTSISETMASSGPTTTDPQVRTLVLTSSDGEKFEVQLQVALQSETIRQMIVDGGFSEEIVLPFPNITGEIMAKVLEYCNKHVYYAGDGAGSNITAVNEMTEFDTRFVDVHYETLFKLAVAAEDLKIKTLVDVVSERIFDIMKGKKPREIVNMFNDEYIKCRLRYGFEFSNFLNANIFMASIAYVYDDM